jgi:hypothetical protein
MRFQGGGLSLGQDSRVLRSGLIGLQGGDLGLQALEVGLVVGGLVASRVGDDGGDQHEADRRCHEVPDGQKNWTTWETGEEELDHDQAVRPVRYCSTVTFSMRRP